MTIFEAEDEDSFDEDTEITEAVSLHREKSLNLIIIIMTSTAKENSCMLKCE